VTAGRELPDAHAAAHAALVGDGGGPYGHFRPGVRVPHRALAIRLGGRDRPPPYASCIPWTS
jgi:hypothetical protein